MSESFIPKFSTNANGSKVVEIEGATFELTKGGDLLVSAAGWNVQVLHSANGNMADAQAALYVGKRLEDGTVVCSVDWKKNIAKAVPAGVFGGESDHFYMQAVAYRANEGQGLHGHKDWRLGDDEELEGVKNNWPVIAPPELQGSAASWFWGAAVCYRGDDARVWHPGMGEGHTIFRGRLLPVPLVRSFPARS
jgi:hypothetical protein